MSKMGRKLGNALIIYGVLNFFACFAFGPYVALGGFVWMIILIALGKWQRDKAKYSKRLAQLEAQQRQPEVNVNLTNQIANQPQVQPQPDKVTYDALANTVNKILDEREATKRP